MIAPNPNNTSEENQKLLDAYIKHSIHEKLCVICQKPVPDYVPEYCCSGEGCGCLGLPIEPPLCSKECGNKLMGI